MRIRSFKLRLSDRHARIVPATDESGCPFAGPGVDLRGEAADEAIGQAGPLLDAIRAFEPGVVIRSVSIDLEKQRLLATLDPTTPEADERPRVVKIEGGPAMRGLMPLAEVLAAALARLAKPVLAARRTSESGEGGGG